MNWFFKNAVYCFQQYCALFSSSMVSYLTFPVQYFGEYCNLEWFLFGCERNGTLREVAIHVY